AGWYALGGNERLWGERSTYSTYSLIPQVSLPALDPRQFDGSFAWLSPLPSGDHCLDFQSPTPSLVNLERLTAQAARHGFSIPRSFTTFITRPDLHRRVPTCTDCYLDIPSRFSEGPA